jgi:hypothetical protein
MILAHPAASGRFTLYTVDRAILLTDKARRAIGAYYGAGTGLRWAGAALRDGLRAARLMLVWRFHISSNAAVE